MEFIPLCLDPWSKREPQMDTDEHGSMLCSLPRSLTEEEEPQMNTDGSPSSKVSICIRMVDLRMPPMIQGISPLSKIFPLYWRGRMRVRLERGRG
jgi:hypothetical protein